MCNLDLEPLRHAFQSREIILHAADYDGQVNAAVQSDPDVEAFVERLEQAAESEADDEAQSLPSGDMIARELQRFLRQRGGEGQPPPAA